MSELLVLEPDTRFIDRVLAAGGENLKKCFQCATCTSVCALSNEANAFPRKQMIEAQWGLKEKVLADPAIWLCHNCGDCTAQCPRGADPAEALGAIRREAIKHYAFPRFLGEWVSNSKYLPLLFLLPVLIFGFIGALGLRHPPTRPFVYAELFPANILEPLFFLVAGWVLLTFALGAGRFTKALRAGGAGGQIVKNLSPVLAEILVHARFSKCEVERSRRWAHLLTLLGFLGLAFMGTAVGVGTMFGLMHTPLPLLSPWKHLANVSAAVILVGLVLVFVRWANPAPQGSKRTYFDRFFLFTLAGVVATGILSELLRFTQVPVLMYPVYFVHLILIFALLLYAPYSKFAHLLYRTVAMAATR